jgi:hypothetical protein
MFNQSLVGLVVIDVKFGMDDHGSIPHNCNRRKAGTTLCQNWPQIILDGLVDQILVVKKNAPSNLKYKQELIKINFLWQNFSYIWDWV